MWCHFAPGDDAYTCGPLKITALSILSYSPSPRPLNRRLLTGTVMQPPKPLLCFFNPPLELIIKWGVYSISTRLRNTNKILLSRISPSPFPPDAMPRHRRASYRGCLPPPGLHPHAHPRAHRHPQRTPAHTPLPQSTGSGESSVEGSSSVSTSVAGSSPVKPVYPRMQLSRSCDAEFKV